MLAINLFIVALAIVTAIPVITLSKKMNDTLEIAFIGSAIMLIAFAVPTAIMPDPGPGYIACVGSAFLLFSRQGRALLNETGFIPFEVTAIWFHRVKSILLAERSNMDYAYWREAKWNLYELLKGCPNRAIDSNIDPKAV